MAVVNHCIVHYIFIQFKLDWTWTVSIHDNEYLDAYVSIKLNVRLNVQVKKQFACRILTATIFEIAV